VREMDPGKLERALVYYQAGLRRAYDSVMRRLQDLHSQISGVTDVARFIEAFATDVREMIVLDLSLSYKAVAGRAMAPSKVVQ
jgi:hypothetical protein